MVILYNPHVDDFLAEPPHFSFLKRRALKKYGFFITESLRKGYEVKVLVDGTSSAFVPESIFHKLPGSIRQAVASFEFRLWKQINRFGSSVIRVQPPKVQCGDVLLAFSYKAATGDFLLRSEVFEKYRAVVFHLSHYFVSTRDKSDNIRTLGNAWLAGDSDITDNAYFQRWFAWYKRRLLVLPFAVAPRFAVKKRFSDRRARCVATGTFHDLTREYPRRRYVDFMSTTGSTTYHPIRKEIFENRESMANVLECRVSPYRRYANGPRGLSVLRHLSVSQKRYFATDLVELYNDYQAAVIGEELSGFPAVGALEAMACGCAVMAIPGCYVGLGLLPYKHYIPYDGGLAQLKEALNRVGAAQSEEIGTNAARYVTHEFGPASMMTRWRRVLDSASREGCVEGPEPSLIAGVDGHAENVAVGGGES